MYNHIRLKENEATPLSSVDRTEKKFPFNMSREYEDIPANKIIVVKGMKSVCFWIRMSGGNSAKFRVMAAFDEHPEHWYHLPLQLIPTSAIQMQPSMFEVSTNGAYNFVFNAPIFGLVKYIKLQAKGNGVLEHAAVSFTN